MRRGFWFLAGAGAGVYAMARARRAAEALTPEGLRDRMAGLGVGARLFGEEVRAGMAEKETELRERIALGPDGSGRAIDAGASGHAAPVGDAPARPIDATATGAQPATQPATQPKTQPKTQPDTQPAAERELT